MQADSVTLNLVPVIVEVMAVLKDHHLVPASVDIASSIRTICPTSR